MKRSGGLSTAEEKSSNKRVCSSTDIYEVSFTYILLYGCVEQPSLETTEFTAHTSVIGSLGISHETHDPFGHGCTMIFFRISSYETIAAVNPRRSIVPHGDVWEPWYTTIILFRDIVRIVDALWFTVKFTIFPKKSTSY